MAFHRHDWQKVSLIKRGGGKGMEYMEQWLVRCSICHKSKKQWYG